MPAYLASPRTDPHGCKRPTLRVCWLTKCRFAPVHALLWPLKISCEDDSRSWGGSSAHIAGGGGLLMKQARKQARNRQGRCPEEGKAHVRESLLPIRAPLLAIATECVNCCKHGASYGNQRQKPVLCMCAIFDGVRCSLISVVATEAVSRAGSFEGSHAGAQTLQNTVFY